MIPVLIGIVISALLLVGFIVAVIKAIAKRKKKYVGWALGALLALAVTGSVTTYLAARKAYHAVASLLQLRTGDEIYATLFGEPRNNCLKVLHYQDQIIPKIDYAIWLHFETCPPELNRILRQNHYDKEKVSTKGWNTTGPLADDNWFKPESLGDSILVFTYKKDEYGNVQTIYTSPDSTKVYCIDVLD
jgi:hypothetical protein